MIRIENWTVRGKTLDPYKPPEQGMILFLEGEVFGHPHHQDGHKVVTSAIMHADGRKVMTIHSDYLLGTVSPKYKKWYEEHEGKPFNEDDPFA